MLRAGSYLRISDRSVSVSHNPTVAGALFVFDRVADEPRRYSALRPTQWTRAPPRTLREDVILSGGKGDMIFRSPQMAFHSRRRILVWQYSQF